MPEGHTLHALARDLTGAFAGTRPRVSSPQGRFADGAALLDGTVLVGARAHGKLLLVDFAGERSVHVHLGLYGTFRVARRPASEGPGDEPPVVGAVRLRLLTPDWVADLRGPMACRVVDPREVETLLARQGPDPLQPGADPELAWARVRTSSRRVAELLMDQKVLAGVGNVYRSEVLWRHRLSPHTPGRQLRARSWRAVWDDLVRLMPLGVASGRIVTVAEDVAAVEEDLAAGRVPDAGPRVSNVYRRTGEPCPRCGSTIRTAVVAGRNLYWCATCQRRR
ncbi:Fpg/Nei family DNA glycosylase [Ornithinicoccus halotolerans]|uniref:Fpg/Nei family DNA glycosylase n=1 Tax=Ornithinicoccus halotolerans TaxID=1748220 RepID=UPI001297FC6E|nr:zinc finger domain-containing protein [Ornithinicoccus halotolerans]